MESFLRAIPYFLLGAVALWVLFALGVAVFSRLAPNSPRTKVYDKVAWYVGNLPAEEIERAYVPYGFLVGWLIDNGLASHRLPSEVPGWVSRFRKREVSGPRLYQELDGVLTSDLVGKAGASFLAWYLQGGRNRRFWRDYRNVFGEAALDSLSVEDTWENYGKLKVAVDSSYAEWQGQNGGA